MLKPREPLQVPGLQYVWMVGRADECNGPETRKDAQPSQVQILHHPHGGQIGGLVTLTDACAACLGACAVQTDREDPAHGTPCVGHGCSFIQ